MRITLDHLRRQSEIVRTIDLTFAVHGSDAHADAPARDFQSEKVLAVLLDKFVGDQTPEVWESCSHENRDSWSELLLQKKLLLFHERCEVRCRFVEDEDVMTSKFESLDGADEIADEYSSLTIAPPQDTK